MNGFDVRALVLEGGEEYIIVGTVKLSRIRAAKDVVAKAGGELFEIGMATSKRGVVKLRSGGNLTPIADVGWTHLGGG